MDIILGLSTSCLRFPKKWAACNFSKSCSKVNSGAPVLQRCVSGAPYLRKFGNPSISKILVVTWLSVHTFICPYICTVTKPHTMKNKSSTISIGKSLMLGIHGIINWQLSNQGIHWPVSCDYIMGSAQELIKVVCFFEVNRWPGTGFSIGLQAQARLLLWERGWE